VIENHLLGEHTIGVYPMLNDETMLVSRCRF
jgi:hypothetical protein